MRKLLAGFLLVSVAFVLAGAENVDQDGALQKSESEFNLQRSVREAEAGKSKEEKKRKRRRSKKKTLKEKKRKNMKKRKSGKKGKSAKKRNQGKKKGLRRKKKGGNKAQKKRRGKKKSKGKSAKKRKNKNKKKTKSGRRKKKNGGKKKKKGKGKGKKRNGKKQRKAKQGGRKSGKKRNNGGRRRLKLKHRSGTGRQTCTVSNSCLDTSVQYMKLLKDKVKNYRNQFSRITAQAKIGGKKFDKRMDFSKQGKKVLQLAGGNASSFACGGKTGNNGAKMMKDLFDKLDNCSNTISPVCDNTTLALPNETATTACLDMMTKFETAVTACTNKAGAEACTCMETAELSTMAGAVRKCDLSSEATAMAKKLSTCKEAFAGCKGKIDESAPIMHSCNVNPEALLSKAKSLKNNLNLVRSALAAIKALAGRRQNWMRARQAASCATVVEKGNKLKQMISADPSNPSIGEAAKEIVDAKSVTCSADEKAKLKTLSEDLEEAAEDISETLENVLETIETASGSKPSDDDIDKAPDCEEKCDALGTAPPTTATKASIRRRRLVVEEILRQNIL